MESVSSDAITLKISNVDKSAKARRVALSPVQPNKTMAQNQANEERARDALIGFLAGVEHRLTVEDINTLTHSVVSGRLHREVFHFTMRGYLVNANPDIDRVNQLFHDMRETEGVSLNSTPSNGSSSLTTSTTGGRVVDSSPAIATMNDATSITTYLIGRGGDDDQVHRHVENIDMILTDEQAHEAVDTHLDTTRTMIPNDGQAHEAGVNSTNLAVRAGTLTLISAGHDHDAGDNGTSATATDMT